MDRPVNVYGTTEFWQDGLLECVTDGFGFRNERGVIEWYDGYEPLEDDSHISVVVPYGNGCDLSELQSDKT